MVHQHLFLTVQRLVGFLAMVEAVVLNYEDDVEEDGEETQTKLCWVTEY